MKQSVKDIILEEYVALRKDKVNQMPLWEKEQYLQSAYPSKVTQTPTGRLSIKTSRGTKTYSPNNIKLAYGERKQGTAYYVSYKGKRVTWGLL